MGQKHNYMRSWWKKKQQAWVPPLEAPLASGVWASVFFLTRTHKDLKNNNKNNTLGGKWDSHSSWPRSKDSSRASLRGTCKSRQQRSRKRGGPGGRGAKQRCPKYIGDITQKILDAAEGCTGGVQNQDRQVGRVQSKEGHEWQARCILYPVGKRELLRGWWQGGQGRFRKRSLSYGWLQPSGKPEDRPVVLARHYNILFYHHHRLMNSARRTILPSFYRLKTGAQDGPTVRWRLGPGETSLARWWLQSCPIFNKSTHCMLSPVNIHL